MKDKDFIKKILQEQELKLNNIDFTNQVMHRISLQQERKKRYFQAVIFMTFAVLIAWMYITIKPYFKEFIQPLFYTWKTQEFSQFISFPYLICYIVLILAIGFLMYDNENNIVGKA